MYQSLKKYFSYPVVKVVSTKNLDDISEQVILICQDGQTNFDKLKENGYDWIFDLLAGKLNNNGSATARWNGIHQNVSFFELIYTQDYTNFQAFLESEDWNCRYKANLTETFLLSDGFCKRLTTADFNDSFGMESKENMKILVVDSNEETRLTIPKLPHNSLETKILSIPQLYHAHHYRMMFEVHDKSIEEDSTCTKYDLTDTTYGQCIEDAIKQQLHLWFDCIPPWFQVFFLNLLLKIII